MKVIIYCQTDIYNQVYFTVLKQKHANWAIHKKILADTLLIEHMKIKKNKICLITAGKGIDFDPKLFLRHSLKS